MGLFSSDPTKKLQKQYEKILLQARDAQRNGDITGSAQLHAQAAELQQKISELAAAKS